MPLTEAERMINEAAISAYKAYIETMRPIPISQRIADRLCKCAVRPSRPTPSEDQKRDAP